MAACSAVSGGSDGAVLLQLPVEGLPSIPVPIHTTDELRNLKAAIAHLLTKVEAHELAHADLNNRVASLEAGVIRRSPPSELEELGGSEEHAGIGLIVPQASHSGSDLAGSADRSVTFAGSVADSDGTLSGSLGDASSKTHSNHSVKSIKMQSLVQRETSHAIQDSTWEVLILIGVEGVGWAGSCMIAFSCLSNAVIQVLFALICNAGLAEKDIGKDVPNKMREWRLSAAHSYAFMDTISWTSLVTRVCDLDDSLVIANGQTDRLKSIKEYRAPMSSVLEYFSNGSDGTEVSRVACDDMTMGTMLTLVVVVFWALIICKEITSIIKYTDAIWNVPSGETSMRFRKGDTLEFESISLRRKAFVCYGASIRLIVAMFLGFAGFHWLSHTAVIEELILNAAALAFVLELDEIIYAAVTPERTRIIVQRLMPLKRTSTNTCHGLGVVPVFATLATILTASCCMKLWTLPMARVMSEIDYIMCHGNTEFVVDVNPELGAVIVGRTSALPHQQDLSHSWTCEMNENWKIGNHITTVEMHVVDEFLNIDPLGLGQGNTQQLSGWWENTQFGFLRARALSRSDENPPFCSNLVKTDLLSFFSPRGTSMLHVLIFNYKHRNRTLSGARNCDDFIAYCNEKDAVWLRFACSLSCGCSDPFSGLIDRTGCQQSCLSVRKNLMEEVDCEDPTPEKLRVDPHFNHFIEHFDPFYDLSLNLAEGSMNVGTMNKTALRELGCGFTRDGDTLRTVFSWATEAHLGLICGADPVKTNARVLLDTDKVTFRAFCPKSCFCGHPDAWTEECPGSCRKGAGTKGKTEGCLGGICGGNPPKGICSSFHSAYYSGMFSAEMCPDQIAYLETVCCPNGGMPASCDAGLCVHSNARVIEGKMVSQMSMTCQELDEFLKRSADQERCLLERLTTAYLCCNYD